MKMLIEKLESRMFLSATFSSTAVADLSALVSDAQSVKASFVQYLPALNADLAAVRSDLVGTGAHNAVLSAKLHVDDVRSYLVLKSAVTAFGNIEGGVGRKVIADGLRLLAHPDNSTYQSRVTYDAANFSTPGTQVLNAFGPAAAASSAQAGADLAEISAANPSNTALATDINSVTTTGSAFVNAMQAGTQAIEADLTKLVNDISMGA